MPLITITQKDILRGKLVDPDWYRCKIDDVGEKTSKAGDSQNFPVEATILFNATTKSEEFKNVPLTWTFNEKAIGFAIGFLDSLGVEVPADGGRFELAACAGKTIDVYVSRGEYDGRPVNRVEHKYRKPID